MQKNISAPNILRNGAYNALRNAFCNDFCNTFCTATQSTLSKISSKILRKIYIAFSVFLLIFNQTLAKSTAKSTQSTAQMPLQITLYVIENVAGHNMSAAFGKIENLTDETITLKSVSSDISHTTELHQTTKNSNGISKMEKIDSLLIKPKSSLQLKPKSYHIMFIGVDSVLKAGGSAAIKITFQKGNETITLPIAQVPIITRKELEKHLQNLGITIDLDTHSPRKNHHSH